MIVDFDELLDDNNITVIKTNIGTRLGDVYKINNDLVLTDNRTKLLVKSNDQKDIVEFIKALKKSNVTHKIPGSNEIYTYKSGKWVETDNVCKLEQTGVIVKGFTRELV